METIKKHLSATHAAPVLSEVEKHMRRYDFASARKAFDQLANVLDIHLEAMENE